MIYAQAEITMVFRHKQTIMACESVHRFAKRWLNDYWIVANDIEYSWL